MLNGGAVHYPCYVGIYMLVTGNVDFFPSLIVKTAKRAYNLFHRWRVGTFALLARIGDSHRVPSAFTAYL